MSLDKIDIDDVRSTHTARDQRNVKGGFVCESRARTAGIERLE